MDDLLKKISVVAATKTRNIDEIKKIIESGITIIGENRIQEAEEKYDILKNYFAQKKVEFHFIGHLQKNKVKKAVKMFDLIQSVDSIGLAEEIDKAARKVGKKQRILVQVNIGNEPQKSGIEPGKVLEFTNQVKRYQNISVKGLMCIAPDFENKEKTRPYFREMKKLFDESKLQILSMGMSDDYKIAIEEGSSMVRLGRALFGERN